MSTLSPEFAQRFAAEWIAAWNAHDVERVLAHYREDFELRSPVIISTVGEPSGRLCGKAAIRAYWQLALSRIPSLHFELVDVLVGAGCLTLYYRGHRGAAAETFLFDEAGLVQASTACYSALASRA
jgi:ketosteroid isomerase-like protein